MKHFDDLAQYSRIHTYLIPPLSPSPVPEIGIEVLRTIARMDLKVSVSI